MRRASSLQEGSSSAAGDKEGAAEEQVWEARGSGGGAVRGAVRGAGSAAEAGAAERSRRGASAVK